MSLSEEARIVREKLNIVYFSLGEFVTREGVKLTFPRTVSLIKDLGLSSDPLTLAEFLPTALPTKESYLEELRIQREISRAEREKQRDIEREERKKEKLLKDKEREERRKQLDEERRLKKLEKEAKAKAKEKAMLSLEMGEEVKGRKFLQNLIPVLIPFRRQFKDTIVFVDRDTGKVYTDIEKSFYAGFMGLSVQDIYQNAAVAKLIFNPYSLENVYKDAEEFLVINSYNAPEWRKQEYPEDKEAYIPEVIMRVLEHIFPEKDQIQWVLAWICRAVMGRNNTILTLVGAKGVGKTILSSMIGALVGRDYYKVVGNSILTDKFNAPMKDNRLLFIDEVVAKTQEELSKLKSYVNNVIPIEEKGMDTVSTHNYNSIILSCNVEDNLGIQSDDRRYSVPDLTDKNLLTAFDESVINDLAIEFEEGVGPNLIEFGNWILQNHIEYMEKYPDHVPLKTKTFHHVVRSNMKLWEIFTEEYLLSSPYIRVPRAELAKAYERQHKSGDNSKTTYPKNSTTIENFLKSHNYMGKYRMARLVKGDQAKGESKNELIFEIDEILWEEVISKTVEKQTNVDDFDSLLKGDEGDL